MKRAIAVVAAVTLSLAAAPIHALDHSQGYAYIYKVQVGSDNHLWVNVPGNFAAAHGCSTPWWARSQYPITNDITKAQLQIALSSLLSTKEVWIYTSGCTVSSSNGYPVFTMLQIYQPQ